MRYIRTTDNIYESNSPRINKVTRIEENGEEYPCLEISLDYSCFFITRNERIIKESDNLEELFNVFVLKGIDLIHLNEEFTQYRFEGDNEWFDITDTELRTGIYGAIWTDNGLTYVGKMNDNKEFELLCKD